MDELRCLVCHSDDDVQTLSSKLNEIIGDVNNVRSIRNNLKEELSKRYNAHRTSLEQHHGAALRASQSNKLKETLRKKLLAKEIETVQLSRQLHDAEESLRLLEGEIQDREMMRDVLESARSDLRHTSSYLQPILLAHRHQAAIKAFIACPIVPDSVPSLSAAAKGATSLTGCSTIGGVPFPNSGVVKGIPHETSLSALTLISQLLTSLCGIYNISLPYPILLHPQAAVHDHISPSSSSSSSSGSWTSSSATPPTACTALPQLQAGCASVGRGAVTLAPLIGEVLSGDLTDCGSGATDGADRRQGGVGASVPSPATASPSNASRPKERKESWGSDGGEYQYQYQYQHRSSPSASASASANAGTSAHSANPAANNSSTGNGAVDSGGSRVKGGDELGGRDLSGAFGTGKRRVFYFLAPAVRPTPVRGVETLAGTGRQGLAASPIDLCRRRTAASRSSSWGSSQGGGEDCAEGDGDSFAATAIGSSRAPWLLPIGSRDPALQAAAEAEDGWVSTFGAAGSSSSYTGMSRMSARSRANSTLLLPRHLRTVHIVPACGTDVAAGEVCEIAVTCDFERALRLLQLDVVFLLHQLGSAGACAGGEGSASSKNKVGKAKTGPGMPRAATTGEAAASAPGSTGTAVSAPPPPCYPPQALLLNLYAIQRLCVQRVKQYASHLHKPVPPPPAPS